MKALIQKLRRVQSDTVQRIVVLGGGYTTVLMYRRLRAMLGSELRSGRVEVTVVAPTNYHYFHGWTGEVIGGIVDPQNQLTDLRTVLTGARFVYGEATSVDLDEREVRVRLVGTPLEETLRYDHLIFAHGSSEALDLVPGLSEHGFALKGPGALAEFRSHVLEQLEIADSTTDAAEQARRLTFVLAGAGFAGVEMCAALGELFESVKDRYPVLLRTPPRLVLVSSEACILGEWHAEGLPGGGHGGKFERLVRYTERKLRGYGAEIMTNERVAEVTPAGARLASGRFVPAATVLATMGQRRVALPGTNPLVRDVSGRIVTDENLNVVGHENLWAGGDVAHVLHPKTERPCPSNALWAIKHGEHLGANLARAVRKKPLRPFRYPGLAQVASLGLGQGVMEMFGVQLTGPLAWVSRLGFFLWFFPHPVQNIRILTDLATFGITGRRITRVGVPPRRGYASVNATTPKPHAPVSLSVFTS